MVENLKAEEEQDGKYKITWDVKEEGSGYIGSMIWVNGKSHSLASIKNEYVSDVKPEIVMVSAIDYFRNVGDEELLHADPFINYISVSGTNVNETKPVSILVFGYKRLDWYTEISGAEGNDLDYEDIKND
ncbi:hypothetical protein JOC86_002482 [Bacillus pakistanensis]|uniref:Uncharacterized protein n=1 Tax=Rossellomorea pakistanensis TaxID=992288 RepID=A0ABS2NDQ0_9BACI|nr:hypothetical protein [Bacillus pakistanensis]MBM7585940.1 hypothetical protein [Bacillus pakistanensis]